MAESATLCKAVKAALGIPVITGMAVENPGVDMWLLGYLCSC